MYIRHFSISASFHFVLLAALPAFADPATFMALGDLPGDPIVSLATGLSFDGSVVVGIGDAREVGFSILGHAFRWTSATGMLGFGDLPGTPTLFRASDVSGDGTVVIGAGQTSAQVNRSFRWTQEGGITELPDIPGGPTDTIAYAVSADGNVIVGRGASSAGVEACRWIGNQAPMGLGVLPGGVFLSDAGGISADGSVIVGSSSTSIGGQFGFSAFRWTEATGMVGIGDFDGGSLRSRANAISANGSIMVGVGSSSTGSQAFRWTESAGMINLGVLPIVPGFPHDSTALAVSDGSVVVGQSASGSSFEAFIWDELYGMRPLRDVLIHQFNLDLSGWNLSNATAITPDGLTIAGYGVNPQGNGEAWVVHLPEPSTLTLLVGAAIALFGRRARRCG